MKQNLSINLLVRLQKLDFSLDEVVIEFEKVFKEKGMDWPRFCRHHFMRLN